MVVRSSMIGEESEQFRSMSSQIFLSRGDLLTNDNIGNTKRKRKCIYNEKEESKQTPQLTQRNLDGNLRGQLTYGNSNETLIVQQKEDFKHMNNNNGKTIVENIFKDEKEMISCNEKHKHEESRKSGTSNKIQQKTNTKKILFRFIHILIFIAVITPFTIKLGKAFISLKFYFAIIIDKPEKIDLLRQQINSRTAASIAEAIKTYDGIRKLVLSYNDIRAFGARELCKALAKHKKIEELYLSGNNIEIAGAKDVAKAIKSMRNLKALGLGKNSIGSSGAKLLANSIKGLNISYLNVQDNDIGNDGCEYLIKALRGNRHLKILYMIRGNNISHGCVEKIHNLSELNQFEILQ